MQNFWQAIDDIDLALEISEQPCPRAYIIKGDALYHLGDFEHALGNNFHELASFNSHNL